MVLPMNTIPSTLGPHVACIMDGNGRWAKRRGLPRTAGHTAGEENLAEVVRIASARGVAYLTVFGFSSGEYSLHIYSDSDTF